MKGGRSIPGRGDGECEEEEGPAPEKGWRGWGRLTPCGRLDKGDWRGEQDMGSVSHKMVWIIFRINSNTLEKSRWKSDLIQVTL